MNAILKTQDELVAYYRERAPKELFGEAFSDIGAFLTADNLQPLCRKDADLSDHNPKECTREGVLMLMSSYIGFAWDKAMGHRGLSAGRSLRHFETWLWLLGDDETLAFLRDDNNYPQYGCPVLKRIGEKYSFPIPDGVGVGRMGVGLPCNEDCREGCGT